MTHHHVIDEVSQTWIWITNEELWQWLKAERKWADAVRRWLRAEGVPQDTLNRRHMGKPEGPRSFNRAARRQMKFKRVS